MKAQIYVALSTFARESAQPLQLLKAGGLPFEINATGKRLTKDQVKTILKDYDGVVAGVEPYDADVLGALPRLRCISRCGVGVDNIDMPQAKARGITVLNTPEAVVRPVVELTLGLVMDLLRKVTFHTELLRQKKWEKMTGLQLAGRKIGIIGLGRIGRQVAQLFKKLDADVYGYDLVPDPAWATKAGVKLLGFYDLLKECDVVTLHISVTPEYPFCMGTEELAHMKKGAMLVNVSRGSLVDEGALVAALRSGHLAGAALDVYSQEPYAGPLCDCPNAILTPHVATLTEESRAAMEAQAVENLIRFFKEHRS